MSESKRLEGKACLITGGAAGIGRATAQKFVTGGATVVMCDVDEVEGHEVAQRLACNTTFFAVNVADRQAVMPVMVRQGRGVTLNASSVTGLYGNFGQTNYVAAKAGIVGMTPVWSRELGHYGVRVNEVAPGFYLHVDDCRHARQDPNPHA